MKLASSLTTLLIASSGVFAGDPTPGYNLKTETEITGSIGSVSQISTGALQGVFLTVKTKGDTLDVYLAPADFIKIFDVQLKPGVEITATGSKVKFGDKEIMLARAVGIGKVDLILRDPKGTPQWLWMNRHDIPTGL